MKENNFSMSIGELRTNTVLLVKRYFYQVENHCVIMNQKHRLLCLCIHIYLFLCPLNLFKKMDTKISFTLMFIRRMKNKQTSQWLKEEF